jgi:hypothetical protein
MHTIFRKNDNKIEWTWLSRSTDGEYVNNGNVTFTLYSGYELDPTTGERTPTTSSVNVVVYGPVAMQYVAGSNGKYQGMLPASVNLNEALQYTLEINATA